MVIIYDAEQKNPKAPPFLFSMSFCCFCISFNVLSFIVFVKIIIITILIMLLLLLILLAAISVIATAISEENLFSNTPLDMSAVQDLSQNSLTLQDLPEDSVFTEYSGDLFDDSEANDFFSTEPQDSSFSDLQDANLLEASCVTGDVQSSNKLRTRDVCTPPAPASASLEPFKSDTYWDTIRSGIDERILQLRPKTKDIRCLPNFQNHLCCQSVDKVLPFTSWDMPLMVPPGFIIWRYTRDCIPGACVFNINPCPPYQYFV